MNKKTLFIAIPSIIISLALPTKILAAGANTTDQCQPIFGGGQTCLQSTNLTIDKTVQNPQTGTFVNNLEITDPKYTPGQTINFQITLKNTSNSPITNISLKDIFPQKYLNFSTGPGKFDTTTHTLNTTIDKLNPNESKTISIQGKIVNQNQLPGHTVCIINQAQAILNNQTNQDNAGFCILKPTATLSLLPATNNPPTTTKGGLPVFNSPQTKRTPATGPEDFALFSLIPTGALGLYFRKKTK